jgi:hypothetical protein
MLVLATLLEKIPPFFGKGITQDFVVIFNEFWHLFFKAKWHCRRARAPR